MQAGRGQGQSGARVLVGVPAYRGVHHIAATLRSIQEQEFTEFHALVSVDDADHETARACELFLSDPRFSVAVQDRRLGWDGNINWLVAQTRTEFFCYWPQDDLATKDYLLSLVKFADANPSFVCAFSDIQWFEQEQALSTFPSLTGFALTRALYVLESMNGVPFRGLTRKDAADRVGPIRRTEFESAHEEFVWLAKLAREGKFGRVEGPIYYKRKHEGSLSPKWHKRETSWKRAVWLEFGVGMLEAILPAVADSEREAALSVVLERLCCPKDGRFRFYDPSPEPFAFAEEFLAKARERCGIGSAGGASPRARDNEIIAETIGFWLDREAVIRNYLGRLTSDLSRRGSLELSFQQDDPATKLLETGWASPEPWGTWSGAPSATLRLPIPNDQDGWRLAFLCRAFASRTHRQTVRVGIEGGAESTQWQFETDEFCRKEVCLQPQKAATIIRFGFPDAVSPFALGRGEDSRSLALGLVKVTISRPEVAS